MAATLMGEWPPLVRPQNNLPSPGSRNRVLNKLFSSKQRLLSLTSPPHKSQPLASPIAATNNNSQEENKIATDESDSSLKVFKKLMPGPKVRDALFRKFIDKEDEEHDKTKESAKEADQESFFRRLLRDNKEEDEKVVRSEELANSEGFFRRLFRDRGDAEEKVGAKSGEEDEKDGFFRRLFREKSEDPREKRDGQDKDEDDDKGNASCDEDEGSDFLSFRRIFRIHPEDEKTLSTSMENCSLSTPESSPGTENFFKRLFRDRDRSVEDSELFSLKRQREVSLNAIPSSFSPFGVCLVCGCLLSIVFELFHLYYVI